MSCTSHIRAGQGDRVGPSQTDAVDALTLTHLLRADLLPEAYIAPRELREIARIAATGPG